MEAGASLTPSITLCYCRPFGLSMCGTETGMTFVRGSDGAHVAELYTEKAALQNVGHKNFFAQISFKH